MMTKKQLLQALSLLNEEDQINAVFQGKYSTKYPADVRGVNIVFENNAPKASLLLHEIVEEDESKRAA